MDKIIILDDVIDADTQNSIESVLFDKDINWTFGRKLNYVSHPEVTQKQRSSLMGFSHLVVNNGQIYSDRFELYCSPIVALADKLNFKIESLFNLRAQLQLPVITDDEFGVPHVDGYNEKPFKVCIYYVNDSDGDTIIFKQTTKNSTPEQIKNKEYDEEVRITPKKGRIVILDGDIYHAAGRPKGDVRCILNYNIYLK